MYSTTPPHTHTHALIRSAKEPNRRQRDHLAPPADTSAARGLCQYYTSRTPRQWQHSRWPDRGEAPTVLQRGGGERGSDSYSYKHPLGKQHTARCRVATIDLTASVSDMPIA